MNKLILTILLLLASTEAWAACPSGVCYVRTNGGTSTQCTGGADADYDGSGSGEACSFNHPNWALELIGQPAGAMVGGDTLVIVNGEYTIGCLGSGTDCRDANYNITLSATCDNDYPEACAPEATPDGTSGDHTKIIGCSLTGCGCSVTDGVMTCSTTPPILKGQGGIVPSGNISGVLNLNDTDYVDVQDIEITDDADCGIGNASYPCYPYTSDMATANNGITLRGATNVTLDGLKIHGMRVYALYGGSVSDITITDSLFNYNPLAGWNLDTCGGDGTCGASGTIMIDSSSFNHNGCVENNPGYGTIATGGCYNGNNGGDGDGIGSGNTGGTWVVTDSQFSYNTADGLDLLYLNRGGYSGGSVSVKRSTFEGNSGNCVKGPNAMYIEDSFLIGNCGYFHGKTITLSGLDDCRSNTGNPIAIEFKSGDATEPQILNNTILSNGDIGLGTSGTCAAGIDIIDSNNIWLGGRQFNQDTSFFPAGSSDTSSIYYEDGGTCNPDRVETNNICYGWKEGSESCDGTGSTDTVDPLFDGTILMGPQSGGGYFTANNFRDELYLQSGSSARDFADETVSADDDALDYNSFARGASWDNGAVEFGSTPAGAVCGNGVLESGEACDDSNTTNGDGCSSTCTIETPDPTPTGSFKGSISGGLMRMVGGNLRIQ